MDALQGVSTGRAELSLTITARDAQGAPVTLHLVPEPGTLSLLALGAMALTFLRRHRTAR